MILITHSNETNTHVIDKDIQIVSCIFAEVILQWSYPEIYDKTIAQDFFRNEHVAAQAESFVPAIMDDDTAGDNTSTREMLFGAGNNSFFYDQSGQLNSTSARQGVNADGSNFLAAGFGQATGYWTGNEGKRMSAFGDDIGGGAPSITPQVVIDHLPSPPSTVIPATTVPRVRPPLKSMAQAQQQPQPPHPNVNVRRSPLARSYYDASSQPSQHSNSSGGFSGFESARQQQQQQIGQLAMVEQQQPIMYEDMFTSAAGMNVMPRQQGVDPRLKDFTSHHQQFQPASTTSGLRQYVMDSSPNLPSGLDLFHGEPWDVNEFWTLDSNAFGGHQLMQHRNSLTPDSLVFQQRPMSGAAPNNNANQSYLTQAAYDPSRRSARGHHDVAPPPRTWIPSQLSYDSGAATHGAMVAPPRTIGARVPSSGAGSSSTRKTRPLGDGGDGERKKPRANYSPMAGENRLKISFVGLGSPGEIPQHFGTKGFVIPDGLSGMHQVYHQRWRFDIRHEKIDDTICVSWSITNMASGTTCARTETPREARVRETSGHTICNQLLRQALKSRATELEHLLTTLRDNPTKFSNTESLIKALRPKSCILGLLFFGLLHDAVQHRMRDMVVQGRHVVRPITHPALGDDGHKNGPLPDDGDDQGGSGADSETGVEEGSPLGTEDVAHGVVPDADGSTADVADQ
jgi:hypothetical protein